MYRGYLLLSAFLSGKSVSVFVGFLPKACCLHLHISMYGARLRLL